MLLSDYLPKKDIRKFNHLKRTLQQEAKPRDKPRPRNKPKENYSHREWEEIMGKHRDIYVRKNGAVRRK